MIRIVAVPNYFEPYRREIVEREWRDGITLRDLLPDGFEEERSTAWVNGEPTRDFDSQVGEGSFVHIVVAPGIAFIAGLHWAVQILIAVAVIAASAIVSKWLIGQLDKPVEDPDGSPNNGFNGFRNAYEVGGAALVVYGRHRVAGPIINQTIEVAAGGFVTSNTEALRVLQVISEGPISGFEGYETPVATTAEYSAAINDPLNLGPVLDRIGMQINGQPAVNFNSVAVEWRTGELNQDPIPGWTDISQVVEIDQTFTFEPNINESDFASGVFTSGTDLPTGGSNEFIEYQFTDQFDAARIQLFFTGGLYTADPGAGQYLPRAVQFRIQYFSTDSGGVRTGDTIILPEITISSASQAPVAFDWPVTLFSAAGYIGQARGGYFTANGGIASPSHVEIATPIDPSVLPSNFADPPNLSWSADAFIRPKDFIFNVPNNSIFSNVGGTVTSIDSSFPFQHNPPAAASNTGVSLRLVANFQIPLTSVHIILEGWQGSSFQTMYRTTTSLGEIGDPDFNNAWNHVGVSVSGSADPTVTFYWNSQPLTSVKIGSWSITGVPRFNVAGPLRVGVHGKVGAGGGTGQGSFADIADFALFDGVKPASYFTARASTINIYNANDYNVSGDEAGLVAGVRIWTFAPSPDFVNIAQPASTDAGVKFTASAVLSLNAAPQADAPTVTAESGIAVRDHYKLQLFRSSDEFDDVQDGADEANWDTVTLELFEALEYPHTALISTRIVADDQVNNSRPTQTQIARGRIVKIWDGNDLQFPTFTEEFTQNNAWLCADALTHPRYGMGNIYSFPDGIDLAKFKEWADHCDEGVEDGFGSQTFFKTAVAPIGVGLPNGTATFSVGLLDASSNPTGNTVPRTWRVGNAIVVRSVDNNDHTNYVTYAIKASLEIRAIQYQQDSAAPDGFTFWVDIGVNWTEKTLVPTISGTSVTGSIVGFEPRCRFDAVMDSTTLGGWDAALQFFQAGRAMPVMLGRKVSVFVDRQRDPVALITMGNIIEGSFQLDWSGAKDRPNSYEVEILDEDRNWERTPYVFNHASIGTPGAFSSMFKDRVRMRGVTRYTQARRDANFRLNQQQQLLRTATFRLGVDGLPLLPGDRFLLSHDVPQYGQSGRIHQSSDQDNLIFEPEDTIAALLNFGGMADAEDDYTMVAGWPTFATPDPNEQEVGAFGNGTASTIRGRTIDDGQDDTGVAFAPSTGVIFSHNGISLYPPNNPTAVLDFIVDADYEARMAVFIKEPALGASTDTRFGFFVAVDVDGATVDDDFSATFRWTAGVLAVVGGSSTGGITASVENPATTGADAGWYRAIVQWRFSDIPGGFTAAIGDPIQLRLHAVFTDEVFSPVGLSSGKGTNFLRFGDPLDTTITSDWTNTDTSAADEPTDPPFFLDGSYGATQVITSDISDGTLAFVAQNLTIPGAGSTFGGAGVVLNEEFTLTCFLREEDGGKSRVSLGNTTDRVLIEIDWATNLSSEIVSGPGTSGHTWALVTQNSTTTDANWYQLDIVVQNVSDESTLEAVIYPYYVASGATDLGNFFWGFRMHGEAASGANVNENFHRGTLAWGFEFHRQFALEDYSPGSFIYLDRDVVLSAGNSYEVEVRSSDTVAAGGVQNRANVNISDIEVPSVGQTAIAAGTGIRLAGSPASFLPAVGDVYSFGVVGQAVVDFSVVSLELNPDDMTRKVVAIEYQDSVYDDDNDLALPDDPITTIAVTAPDGDLGLAFLGGSATVTAAEASHRADDGSIIIAATVSWSPLKSSTASALHSVRVYVQDVTSTPIAAPTLVATVEGRRNSVLIAEYPFIAGNTYRFYARAGGSGSAGRSAAASPYSTLRLWGGVPLPQVPTIEGVSVRGERSVWRSTVDLDLTDAAVDNFEARVGGWIMGQRISSFGADVNAATDEIYSGPMNSAGHGAPPIYVKGRLVGGFYGDALEQHTTGEIVGTDGSDLDIAFEDDWTDGGGATLASTKQDTSRTPPFLVFDLAGSNPSPPIPGPVGVREASWESDQHDLAETRRVYVEAWAEAINDPSFTLDDFDEPLGSRRFQHWTLEGAISGPEKDVASLRIEWRSSATTTLPTDWEEFRPGVAYLKSVQFRLAIRVGANDDFEINRFGIRIRSLPSYDPDDIDGGTF